VEPVRPTETGSRVPLGMLGRVKAMMPGWSAAPPSRPQAFSVACAEGHRLQGQRTEGYQALRCPTCGEGIFVLPRSPLPEPPVPASSTRARFAPEVEPEGFPEDEPLVLSDPIPSNAPVDVPDQAEPEPEAEIDWVDEVPETPRPVSKKPGSPGPDRKPAASKTVPAGRSRDLGPTILVADRPTLAEWALKHRNVLLAAGLLLLIAGTVTFRWRRTRLEDLPRVAELGLTEGIKKLDAGEFHAAKKILSDASEAVDSLGGRFEGAETIRQAALEAAIFADLSPRGLDEILEEAANDDPREWPKHFATFYKGRSILLDPPISAEPDPARPNSHFEVNFPIYFGRGPRGDSKGRIDLNGFRLFELSQPKINEQKPFGARLASVELDVASNEWVVTFEPDSGVFITHPKALEAIDWARPDPSEIPSP